MLSARCLVAAIAWVAVAATCVVADAAAPAAKGAAPAKGDAHAKAVAHLERGKKLGEVGRYEDSIKEFEEAYLLEPIPEILLNIALSYRFMKRYDKAIEFYDRFLRMKPGAPERKDIEARIRELEKEKKAAEEAAKKAAAEEAAKRKAEEEARRKAEEEAAKHGGGGGAVDPKAPVRFTVTSDPPGARVFLAGKEIGKTPLATTFAPGPVVLRFELAGFETKDVGVVAEAGREGMVAATLVRRGGTEPLPVRAPGRVAVTTNVPGAEVLIGGSVVGVAPIAESLELPAGKYRVTARAPGFEATVDALLVTPGRTTPVDVSLRPSSPDWDRLFRRNPSGFLASGLTIEGYWRKKKGRSELIAGAVLAAVGAAITAYGVVRLNTASGFGEVFGAGALAVGLGPPPIVIGGVFALTGVIKLASVGRFRWVRPAPVPAASLPSASHSATRTRPE